MDIAYNQFLQAFKNIFDECCLVKIKIIKNNFKKSWMTPALFKSSKTKDKLFKNYQKNPNADNKHKYNSYNNLFTTIKRKAQKFYLNNKFENAKGNLKETWKIIKEVINNNKNNLVMTDSFKFENKLISNAEEISNKFNEFFVTIGPKLDAKIDPPQTDFKSYLPNNIGDSFFINPTSPDEITRIIGQCKNKYSSGWDNVPMAIIRSVGLHSYLLHHWLTFAIYPFQREFFLLG